MSLVEHARAELERSGQTTEDPAYAASVVAAIAAFVSYGHSGGSAEVALEQLETLLKHRTLTPLTSDPEEWEDRSEISRSPLWQNRRDPAAFSTDAGQTWHFVDDRQPKDQYVMILNGELATNDGRLIVASGEQEKAALVGTVVPLPHEQLTVTEWIGGPDVLDRMTGRRDA